jgi:hypothetical protein
MTNPVCHLVVWLFDRKSSEFSDVVGSSGAKSFAEQDAQDDQS